MLDIRRIIYNGEILAVHKLGCCDVLPHLAGGHTVAFGHLFFDQAARDQSAKL